VVGTNEWLKSKYPFGVSTRRRMGGGGGGGVKFN